MLKLEKPKKLTKKQLTKKDRQELIELVLVGQGALDTMEELNQELKKKDEELDEMNAFAKEQVKSASQNLVKFNNANVEVARLRITIVEMCKADHIPNMPDLEK